MKKYAVCDNDAIVFWGSPYRSRQEAEKALEDARKNGSTYVRHEMKIMPWKEALKRSELN